MTLSPAQLTADQRSELLTSSHYKLTKNAPLSLVIVGNEGSFRAGLRNILNFYTIQSCSHFQVVGEAATIKQACKVVKEQKPNLVLLDLDGFEEQLIKLQSCLQKISAYSKIIAFSTHKEDKCIFSAMQGGTCSYLLKANLVKHLGEAIATVMQGQIYLIPEVATCFFRQFHCWQGFPLEFPLTERETEVLQLLIQGKSNQGIATQLYITVATVKAHLTAVFEKLGVNSRSQAIVKALQLSLV